MLNQYVLIFVTEMDSKDLFLSLLLCLPLLFLLVTQYGTFETAWDYVNY